MTYLFEVWKGHEIFFATMYGQFEVNIPNGNVYRSYVLSHARLAAVDNICR